MMRARPLVLAALACLAAGALAGCRTDSLSAYTTGIEGRANPPPTVSVEEFRLADLKPNERPIGIPDEEGLWLIVDKIEKNTKTAGNRVVDENLNAYVAGITCRVAGPHCTSIRSYVMRVPAFNAFMAPNGMTVIWTGLLLRVRNEAQIAAIIGHEAGHFLRRHSIQRMRNAIDQTNTFTFIQFALAGAGVGAFSNIAALMMGGGMAAFSRDNEREADGYGIVLAAEAGYDPREAAKVWQQLERERKADKDYVGAGHFLASHPPAAERADMLARLGEQYHSPKASDIGRDRYLAAILPVRAGLLRDELNLRRFATFSALVDMLMEDGANLAELHYFKGEMYRLRHENGDDERALAAYRGAKAADGKPPADIDRSMALVHRRLGQKDEARSALSRYLDANPTASDAAMIRQMLEME